MNIDQTLVLAILGVAGVGVAGLTEMIKRFLKASGFAAYAVSFVVSAAATVFVLLQGAMFTWGALVVYTIIVFCEANGLYKLIKKPNAESFR